jgi:hypothetical protein
LATSTGFSSTASRHAGSTPSAALKLTYGDLRKIPEGDPDRHEPYDGMRVSVASPAMRERHGQFGIPEYWIVEIRAVLRRGSSG